MTNHWSGTDNTFPLPSISTSTSMPSPISTYPCFFCDNALYNIQELAGHLITSHGSDLHSMLCPRAGDDSLRNNVAAFLNEYAASGALFVGLCDCFPSHPSHTSTAVASLLGKRKTSLDDSGAYGSGLGSPVSDKSTPPPPSNITPKVAEFLVSVGVTPTTYANRVYLRPYRS
ncbi:hypothetical protein KCU98_g15524, partial [Aureobasidium melanogenum]